MLLRYPQMGTEFFGWRDGGYGPLDLTPKRSEILIILETPFMYVRLDQTSAITAFRLAKGHPTYPVF